MFKKDPLRINTYRSYGTAQRLRAAGRALEDENIKLTSNQGLLKTLKNIYKQFESDEIPNSSIQLQIKDELKFIAETDAEGYYKFDEQVIDLKKYCDGSGWISYQMSYDISSTQREITCNNLFNGQMLIPSQEASYGVISDIDDTILHTGVVSLFKWRVIFNTFFKNFDKRLPLEGTVAFYQKLQHGKTNFPINPIFYVSNSPWNLYDYLTAFLEEHRFPKGPILLRDFRTFFDKTPKPKIPHKHSEIYTILKMYPSLNFILIGDSGEKDADIYTSIAQEYPNRILAIYLRSVNHRKRVARIESIIKSFKICPILLVHTSDQAVKHAHKHGFIS